MPAKTPLSALSREMKGIVVQPELVPVYRQFWNKIVNGDLPVEIVNGRYFCDPRAVAEALGLTLKDAA
ncbi:hypothetical protein [Acidisphaera sp. S103]|uniref:hypothetical protein n=1 Tax=Acidisphaera sp. S103 TaxID=1747223 RepID=UPI00131DB66C|nr:hypothetical protein [Acidisphaera sp. S103]